MSAFAVLRKELDVSFGTPLAYVALAASLALTGFFFYTDLIFFIIWGGGNLPSGLWLHFFLDVRFVMILLVPVLTMRSFAEERRLGTMELMRSYPIGERSILAGKFAAALALFLCLLLLTCINPLLLARHHPIEWAPVATGYLGLALLGTALIAVGLFVSSLTSSQVMAAIGTFGVIVLLWFLTWNQPAFGEGVGAALVQFSLFERFFGFARGVVESRDVVYFIIVTTFFLFATWQVLASERWRNPGQSLTRPHGTGNAGNLSRWAAMGASSLAVLALLGGAEFAAARFNVQWDFTPARAPALSEHGRTALALLEGEVRVTAFYGIKPREYDRVHDLLTHYAKGAPGFRFELLPLDRYRSTAAQSGVANYGGGVVEHEGRRIVLDRIDEDSLTGAFTALAEREQSVVYFTRGHGEHEVEDAGEVTGYSLARQALEGQNLVVRTLDVAHTMDVPDDAAVVIMSGPRSDLNPSVLRGLGKFLRRGGGVLAQLDPAPLPHLVAFLESYGLVIGDGVVLDPENRLVAGEEFTVVVPLYNGLHPITQGFERKTLLSIARPVEPRGDGGSAASSAVPLAMTAPQSFAVAARWDQTGSLDLDESSGRRLGPLSVGVALSVRNDEKPAGGDAPMASDGPSGRLVAYGDSDFANNFFIGVMGNEELFLNTVEWLAHRDQLISRRPERQPSLPLSRVYLTEAQSRRVFWVAVVLEPAFVLMLGIVLCRWRWVRGRSTASTSSV